MITYEMAKELKDAGFPQLYKNGDTLQDGLDNDGYGPQTAYAPTLSELIEACGERFGYLSKGFQHPKWYAGIEKNKLSDVIIEGIGSTPEEAVKNLWLALNKK